MTIIDSKAIQEEIKKSYEELPEPPETVPMEAIIDKIKEKIRKTLALNPRAKILFDSFLGTPADFNPILEFLGTPDYLCYLDASEAAWKKRWLVRNELEEWTEALDEEVANYPDNSQQIVEFFEQKYAGVPADRFWFITINASQTEAGTIDDIKNTFAPKVILLVHDKRFVTDTPCSNLAIKYNLLYLNAFQLIREEIRKQTPLAAKLLASKKPKSINTFDIENDEFEEAKYSAVHFDFSLVLSLIKRTIQQNRTT